MSERHDQLRQLVPEELVECLRKSELTLPNLKGYPHLQRVAGVVYFFLNAREKTYQEGNNQSQRLAEKLLSLPANVSKGGGAWRALKAEIQDKRFKKAAKTF